MSTKKPKPTAKPAAAKVSKTKYQRYVLAGLMVLSPRFRNLARTAPNAEAWGAIEANLKAYGVDPGLFKNQDISLGLTTLQWQVLDAAQTVIFDAVSTDPYDPPDCPDIRSGKALMDAAKALDEK